MAARSDRSGIGRWLNRQNGAFVAVIAVPVIVLAEALSVWSNGALRGQFPLGHDFVAFWAAARVWMQGGLAALYDLPTYAAMQDSVSVRPGLLLWHYPPFYLLLVIPFGLLPFWLGYLGFVAGGLAALAAVARRVIPVPGRLGWMALFGAPGIAVLIAQGQNSAWFAAALIGGFWARDRKRGWAAACLFAMMAAKPQLGILIPVALAARGDWRLIGQTAIATGIYAAVVTLTLGGTAWTMFLDNTSALGLALNEAELLAQMPTAWAALMFLDAPYWAGLSVQLASALIAVIAVWLAWRRRDAGPDLPLAILLMATLMVSPYGFRYDMILTLAGTLLVGRVAQDSGYLPGEKLSLALLWAGPALFPALALSTGLQLGFPLLLLGLWSAWRRLPTH